MKLQMERLEPSGRIVELRESHIKNHTLVPERAMEQRNEAEFQWILGENMSWDRVKRQDKQRAQRSQEQMQHMQR